MSGAGAAPAPPAGLCDACRHRRHVASARSTFVRCGLADVDPEFPRYPRLPVLACAGFEPAPPGDAGRGTDAGLG